ncbi:MAG: glycosyltransferase family 4 protein [Solirubrobacterales bacterium]
MRILLCTQPTDGGVGRHVCDLIEGLTAKGDEVILCSPAIPPGLRQPVTHERLDLRRAIAPRADLVALGRFVRIVRDLQPDLIHAHSSKAGAIARLARPFSPHLPVLYTPHGYAFAGHFNRSAERLAYRCVERVLAPLASRVVCVCEAEARLARSVGPGSRVRVIHNGIAVAADGDVDPRVAELARGGPVIGALTLLRPGKGLETLIAALPDVLARHGDAKVAVVGDGPDLDTLQAQSRALGVADAVHFLGPSADPLAALRGMDVFVHPSWAEAFPYVILEAMSLARPILASDVGGIGEAIIDGESGVLIPPRDERRLAQALIGMLEDPSRRALLGEAALRRVRQEFTRSVMIDRLTGVYGEALRSCSSSSAPAEQPHARAAALADARPPLVRDGER